MLVSHQSAMSSVLWLLDVPVPAALIWFLAMLTSFQIPNDTAARMMKRMMMMTAMTSFLFILAEVDVERRSGGV